MTNEEQKPIGWHPRAQIRLELGIHGGVSTPLREAAIRLGILERGAEDWDKVPHRRFIAAFNAFEGLRTRGRPMNHHARVQLANAVLTGQPLSCVTIICVSDYVGGTRFHRQGGQYAPTRSEKEMFRRVELLRHELESLGVKLEWRVVLADAWGLMLYPERLVEGAIPLYTRMMEDECERRGFEKALSWTDLMTVQHADTFAAACEQARGCLTERMVKWEAFRGEIAHDRPGNDEAMDKARRHIVYRAAEGTVLTERFGPSIVLSTETRSPRRYDNLLVERRDYNAVDLMPRNAHRM